MLKVKIEDDFDLKKIAMSGQCFRVVEFDDGTFRFITENHVLYIRKHADHSYSCSCTESEWNDVWFNYFDLQRNYRRIRKSLSDNSNFMCSASEYGTGIRILRQDPWETLITFIISQRKSIPAIRSVVELISSKCGSAVHTERETIYRFPSPAQLSSLSCEDLQQCKLGYRLSYIQDAVSKVNSNTIDLAGLGNLSDGELVERLETIRGVGIKVASCVALFAYGRTAVVPIDTWIGKIIENEYGGMNPFGNYNEIAGIMQQYAFFYAQGHKSEWKARSDGSLSSLL